MGISNSTIYSAVLAKIEDNVLIGVNNVITDTDNHSICSFDRINGNQNIKSKPVVIKEGA
jgi:acetyltransferase-like isoleucine patch superfamily enzyme